MDADQNDIKVPTTMVGTFIVKKKLLPMLFQVLFHCLDLVGVRRAKSPLVVDIDNSGALKMKNHIGVMIAVDIHEVERHRDGDHSIPGAN